MRTKHRIRRDRNKPQPGSIGAPFQGAFNIAIVDVDDLSGTANVIARHLDGSGNWVPDKRWEPNKVLPLDAFYVNDGGVEAPMISAQVDNQGILITITFTPTSISTRISVEAGHPSLISTTGQACGGANFGA